MSICLSEYISPINSQESFCDLDSSQTLNCQEKVENISENIFKGELAYSVSQKQEILKYPDGSIYEGETINGKGHGKGILKFY